ncbi:hypothetical protein AG1IA_03254 [Rhizoctonia solani AG-1 IA]|uniref:Uncharacterized protein n=1 Tax=Thanatephorus cucumeris (strain AG1-IA) TaxID=983506 RepID=L8X110_THACA|nr:hypothetical protein AG1IA_03254 [Rhizoctonia solani AG-1 IA]
MTISTWIRLIWLFFYPTLVTKRGKARIGKAQGGERGRYYWRAPCIRYAFKIWSSDESSKFSPNKILLLPYSAAGQGKHNFDPQFGLGLLCFLADTRPTHDRADQLFEPMEL